MGVSGWSGARPWYAANREEGRERGSEGRTPNKSLALRREDRDRVLARALLHILLRLHVVQILAVHALVHGLAARAAHQPVDVGHVPLLRERVGARRALRRLLQLLNGRRRRKSLRRRRAGRGAKACARRKGRRAREREGRRGGEHVVSPGENTTSPQCTDIYAPLRGPQAGDETTRVTFSKGATPTILREGGKTRELELEGATFCFSLELSRARNTMAKAAILDTQSCTQHR